MATDLWSYCIIVAPDINNELPLIEARYVLVLNDNPDFGLRVEQNFVKTFLLR